MDKLTDDYVHPNSGRIYRQGDPAHAYALAWDAVHRSARQLFDATDAAARLGPHHDYLDLTVAHPYPDISRMRGALEWLEKAYTDFVVDRDFTSGPERERKYGKVHSGADGSPP